MPLAMEDNVFKLPVTRYAGGLHLWGHDHLNYYKYDFTVTDKVPQIKINMYTM